MAHKLFRQLQKTNLWRTFNILSRNCILWVHTKYTQNRVDRQRSFSVERNLKQLSAAPSSGGRKSVTICIPRLHILVRETVTYKHQRRNHFINRKCPAFDFLRKSYRPCSDTANINFKRLWNVGYRRKFKTLSSQTSSYVYTQVH